MSRQPSFNGLFQSNQTSVGNPDGDTASAGAVILGEQVGKDLGGNGGN
jgi:hypothetical protein